MNFCEQMPSNASHLTKYVDDQFINRKNNTPMWDKIVAEVSAKPAYYGQPPITYTKVSMIDKATTLRHNSSESMNFCEQMPSNASHSATDTSNGTLSSSLKADQ